MNYNSTQALDLPFNPPIDGRRCLASLNGELVQLPMIEDDDCNCAERFIEVVRGGEVLRERLPLPKHARFHNCEHVRKRNQNIVEAEAMATQMTPYDESDDPTYGHRWTKNFARAMEFLCSSIK